MHSFDAFVSAVASECGKARDSVAVELRDMPDHRTPPTFERTWMTLLLTSQVFLGGLLGIAAQGFLVYIVIGLVLPWFGLDLLDLALVVAAVDLPGTLLAWVTATPSH
jgi:hypothetical protein